MERSSTVSIGAMWATLFVAGCAMGGRPIVHLASADQKQPSSDESDQIFSCLSEAMADREDRDRDYEFHLLSIERIPPQSGLSVPASIIQGAAVMNGFPESERLDVVVTVFSIPGHGTAFVSEGVPSKGGWRKRHDLYDTQGAGRLLVIAQGEDSGLGNQIRVLHWDTNSGAVDTLFFAAGEEDGYVFSHSLVLSGTCPELVIHGIFAIKQAGYEKERVDLENRLGIPVRFVYDPP